MLAGSEEPLLLAANGFLQIASMDVDWLKETSRNLHSTDKASYAYLQWQPIKPVANKILTRVTSSQDLNPYNQM
jgi:hypothetical protein